MTAKAILTGGLAAGLLALAPPTQAGTLGVGIVFSIGHHHHGGGHGHRRDTFRIGYDRGYEEGFEHGVKDARRHRDFNYAHDRDYQRADRGYRREYGPRHRYQAGFRNGYEDGYSRGYYSVRGARHRHHGRSDWCYEHHERGDRGYGYDNRYDRDDDRDDHRNCDHHRGRCDRRH